MTAGPQVWPLTPAQQALWFLESFNPGSSFYVIGIGLVLRGRLETAAMRTALADVIDRHEALRTRFLTLGGRPYQTFPPGFDVPEDIEDLSAESDPEQAARTRLEEMSRPFDLSGEPPMRLRLLKLDDETHALLLAVHHIVFDGWSTQVFLTDLAACYEARRAGHEPRLAPPATGVGEYAADLARRHGRALDEDDLNYWRQALHAAPVLQLPVDHARPASRTFEGAVRALHLDAGTSASLRELARALDTTLFTVLGTAFTALVSRLSGNDDVVIGVPLAGRTSADTHGLVGFFANTLPLRVDLAGARTFGESLERHRAPVHELLTRQHVPFADLVDALSPPRRPNRNPYYDVCFQFLPAPAGATAFGDLEVGFLDCARLAAQFDLSCDVQELGDQLLIQFEYSTELFEDSTITTYLDQYATLLREAVGEPVRSRPEPAVVAPAPVVPGGLAGLVAAQAARRPDGPAVRCATRSLTFGELDAAAAGFAARLRALGVGAGDRVGLLLEPSVDLAVAILGVLRLGAVEVPGDVRMPAARTAATLRQAGCRLLVHDLGAAIADDVAARTGLPTATVTAAPDPVELPDLDGSEPAYVIFTSGSTGRPKGVVVGHAAALSLAAAAAEVYQLAESDVVLQMASPAVDVCVEEFFASWQAGAEVFVHGPVVADPGQLAQDRGLTVLNLPAALWHEWSRQVSTGESFVPDGVRLVIAGSDRVDAQRVRQWRSGPGARVRLLNAYGVTEATVSSAWYDTVELNVDAVHTTGVPIGRAFPHAALYVLNDNGEPVSDGAPGELWIGGPGVAIGYLDDPAATAERFRDDPYGPGRMYRTGDLVRRLPSGALDFRGRRDSQVKIRGTRIELAEVERVLGEVPGIAQSCADVRPDENGVPRLIGYLRIDTGAGLATGLSHDRVEEWRQVHDAEVFNEVTGDQRADLNASGWISSYTGTQIDAEAMAQWREEFVRRLADEPPGRVLEIGCGTGMILLPLAARAGHYIGTDISRRALDYITAQLPAGLRDRVRLIEAAAHEVEVLGNEKFDLVIINSVVQYFPTEEYLAEVIESLWHRLLPGGRIVIGDVRDLGLVPALHLSIARHRQPCPADPAEVLSAVAESVETENELCLTPGWFAEIADRLSDVAGVVAYAKTGRARTEMNGFRYDVVLRRAAPGSAHPAGPVPDPIDGSELDEAELSRLCALAATGSPVRVLLPDSRIAPYQALLTELAGPECRDAAEAERLAAGRAAAIHPADIAAAAEARGLPVTVGQAGGGRLDILIGAEPATGPPLAPGPAPRANRPLETAVRREIVSAVRAHLGAHLPKPMVPGRLVFVAEFPQSASGKVDRSRLPDPPRTVSASAGAAPASALEKTIAECWEQVLRVEGITTADNFFEIGGDSISWLQIMSRCARAGVKLSARDVFDHQTVGELAAAAGQRQPQPTADVPRGATEAPLTPIQEWFLTSINEGRDWQNQVQWYDLPDSCYTEVLRQALHDVARQHEGLAAIRYGTDDWVQRIGPVPEPAALPVTEVHLPSNGPRRDELVRAADRAAQTGVSVVEGPLFQFVIFRTPPGEPDFALWCIHHIGVDAVSWQFLTEDLAAAVSARQQGQAPEFQPRTASVLDWSTWSRQAAGQAPADETAHWQAAAGAPALALPVRHLQAAGTYGEAHTRSRRLTVPAVRQISGELLTATALGVVRRVLAPYAGRENGSVWLEFHGRPLDGTGPDVTRTVGWFTALFPFVLQTEESARTRARMAAVPGGGIGYGRLRYLAGRALDTSANVVVNCLSAGPGPVGAAEVVRGRATPEVAGPSVDPRASMPFALELNIMLDPDGSVELDCVVNARHLDSAGADALTDRLARTLLEALASGDRSALLSEQVRGSAGFAALLDRLPELEAAYPLMPMQQLMLNRHLLATAGDANYNESVLLLDGELDLGRFRAAWQAVAARHEVLRTSVEWLGLPEPVQVVHRSAPDPIRFVDWSGLSEARVQRRLTQLLNDERAAPPALSGTPPFRLTLVRTGPSEHRLVWIDHHILLDGWSSAILVEDLLKAYAAGRESEVRPGAVPYRRYVEWWGSRTGEESQEYWRQSLAGFTAPTDLPFDAAPKFAAAGGQDYDDLDVVLPAGLIDAVHRLARARRTTTSNVIAASWAAFLHRYTGNTRVTFGVALSGRPAELGEVTDMVGLYLTTLPQVVDIEADAPAAALVDAVTRSSWQLAEVSPASWLWDVHQWSGIPASRTLFHSVLVVQNYGAATGGTDRSDLPLRARNERSRLVTGAPLTVAIDPAIGTLRLIWDSRVFSRSTADQLITELVGMLERMTSSPEQPVSALPAPRFVRSPIATQPAADSDDRIFLPPQGPLEERIAAIWRDELGLDRIGRDLNLFEAGANSMTVMHMHVVLCRELESEVPLAAFFQYPTVQSMATLFDAGPVVTSGEHQHARTQRRRAALASSGRTRRAAAGRSRDTGGR